MSQLRTTNDCENDLNLKTKKLLAAVNFYGQNTGAETSRFNNLTNLFKNVSLPGLHFNGSIWLFPFQSTVANSIIWARSFIPDSEIYTDTARRFWAFLPQFY